MIQTTPRPRTRALARVGDIGASLKRRHNFRERAPGDLTAEPQQQCVWDVGALLGMVLVVGMTLLFWELVWRGAAWMLGRFIFTDG